MFVPAFTGNGSALLAASIVGATVMPHVIYLHSSLTTKRIVGAHPAARRKIFRFEVIDVGFAMGIAGIINLSMLATAAAVFNSRGLAGAGDDLTSIAAGLDHFLGAHTGTIFGVALLTSGIASSSVGTLSGQLVMEGFLRWRVPVFLRRAITMVPALVLIGIGFNPTRALVLSQVFLSFGIPFALVPLIWFTRDRRIMGLLVNRRLTNVGRLPGQRGHHRAERVPAGLAAGRAPSHRRRNARSSSWPTDGTRQRVCSYPAEPPFQPLAREPNTHSVHRHVDGGPTRNPLGPKWAECATHHALACTNPQPIHWLGNRHGRGCPGGGCPALRLPVGAARPELLTRATMAMATSSQGENRRWTTKPRTTRATMAVRARARNAVMMFGLSLTSGGCCFKVAAAGGRCRSGSAPVRTLVRP